MQKGLPYTGQACWLKGMVGSLHIVGSRLHHPAALGEQTATSVGSLHPALDGMGQGHLRHIARKAKDLAGPVAEAPRSPFTP